MWNHTFSKFICCSLLSKLLKVYTLYAANYMDKSPVLWDHLPSFAHWTSQSWSIVQVGIPWATCLYKYEKMKITKGFVENDWHTFCNMNSVQFAYLYLKSIKQMVFNKSSISILLKPWWQSLVNILKEHLWCVWILICGPLSWELVGESMCFLFQGLYY